MPNECTSVCSPSFVLLHAVVAAKRWSVDAYVVPPSASTPVAVIDGSPSVIVRIDSIEKPENSAGRYRWLQSSSRVAGAASRLWVGSQSSSVESAITRRFASRADWVAFCEVGERNGSLVGSVEL